MADVSHYYNTKVATNNVFSLCLKENKISNTLLFISTSPSAINPLQPGAAYQYPLKTSENF